ncbi:MAG: M23 family metallopeptidase [Clostridia bacterium]|nr:M23 family metallopeptidase [Clostridia bacterium]
MDENNGSNRGESGGMGKAVKFLVGKGFYIVLFLCLGAIGISGYVILFSNNRVDPEISGIPPVGLATTVDFLAPEIETSPSAAASPVGKETGIPAKTTSKPKTTAEKTSRTPSETKQTEPPPETTSETAAETTSAKKIFYSSPLSGEVMKLFSGDVPVFNPTMGDWRIHAGVDIAASVGSEVFSVAQGTVSRVYRDEFKGVCVEILHPDGLSSVYCGLEDIVSVSEGEEVQMGTKLGTVGTTAAFEFSDGPHLHLEIRDGGVALDPLEFFYQGNEN